jgi:hypothetical protein
MMNPLFVAPLIEIGGKLIDRLFPDETKKAEAQMELLKMSQQQDFALILKQVEVNAAEAASPNPWTSGWRPGAGWCCVAGLGYTFLLQPLLAWASSIWNFPSPPPIDADYLLYLLGALLGIGTLRTFEKGRGVASK